MQKQMVSCEDGKDREARVYGVPREDGDFEILLQAGVRIKGRHVTGEAVEKHRPGISGSVVM